MAQVLLQKEFPAATVVSAGLSALIGSPADPMACEVVAVKGMDLSAHRAQQINQAMCQHTDLILVMESQHRADLERMYPTVRGKVFRIGHHQGFDVEDPYRKPIAHFEEACSAIERGLSEWFPRIARLG
jgi:protein-tyrosine phosphatase